MLFVLKLIKNGVNEIIDEAPKVTAPGSSRGGAGAGGSKRATSSGRAPTSKAVADGEGEDQGDGGEGGAGEEEQEEEETLEAAIKDLRLCMDLVMKRLDVGLCALLLLRPPSPSVYPKSF
jgi:hypothetical protein